MAATFITLNTPNGPVKYQYGLKESGIIEVWLPNGNRFFMAKRDGEWKWGDGDIYSAFHTKEEIGEAILNDMVGKKLI